MNQGQLAVVTGSFGYLGKYITRILLEKGYRVRTLSGHPDRPNEFSGKVEAVPFHFDEHEKLVENLKGAETVFNTYWVRFNRGNVTYRKAVADTQNLIKAAKEAGVKRFVHTSITNPTEDSPFEYFSGKAVLERTLRESGLSYAVIRPTILFGEEDILISNIAWMLRHLPVFGIMGKGDYKVQPVFVKDAAKLAVDLSTEKENIVADAVGPEIFQFADLTRLIKKTIGSRALLVKTPPFLGLIMGKLLGLLVGDVLITEEEIGGLMAGLLVSDRPPTCPTRLSEWLTANADRLGKVYASEIARHYK